jgi:hypothetical protein
MATVASNVTKPDVNIARMAGHAILAASTVGDVNLVSHLLTFPKLDPSVSDNIAFRSACAAGHLDVVKILAADDRVDASDYGNHAVRVAARHNRLDVLAYLVDVLGKEGRIDASDLNNEALRSACRLGLVEVVRVLVGDVRVGQGFARDPFGLVVIVAERGRQGIDIVRLLVESLRDCKKKQSVKMMVKRLFPRIANELSWGRNDVKDNDGDSSGDDFLVFENDGDACNGNAPFQFDQLMSTVFAVVVGVAAHPVGYTILSIIVLLVAAILKS